MRISILTVLVFISFRLLAQDFPSVLADKECIILDLSGSVERENSDLIYKWDLGDGTEAYGITVEHCYDSIGEFQASLAIIDPISSMNFDDEYVETVKVLPAVVLEITQSKGEFGQDLEARLTGSSISDATFYWSWENSHESGKKLSGIEKNKEVRVLARFTFQGEETFLSKEIITGS
ncbi:PKD domain-containing protein [Ekhidna sp.]|uniref:PKD domain-containing protein n=1 Tax=Ekhidna sp. TaxID=2608089 RepID=UPI00329748D4